MSEINLGRFHSRPDRDIVVFILGMRIHKLWSIGKWLPIFRQVPAMFGELERAGTSIGYLGGIYKNGFPAPLIIQYWNSLEELTAYARNPSQLHLPLWVEFNRKLGKTDVVGVWHETYLVPKGNAENIYVNMEATGMGKFTHLEQVGKHSERITDRFEQ